jgi:beta-galactosidase
MHRKLNSAHRMSRRNFVCSCAAGAAGVISGSSVLGRARSTDNREVRAASVYRTIPLDQGWLFGGKLTDAALQPGFDDSAFQRISLPHCVSRLSWRKWEPSEWEAVWVYRRHFVLPPEVKDHRVFLHFEGVMVGATPSVNGHGLPKHLGGYLPFDYEITDLLSANGNVVAIALDSRWSNTPPEGSPRGPQSIDYLEPGGIPRPVSLRVVPQVFISDVFVKPVRVLQADRRVEVACSINAAVPLLRPVQIEAVLVDGSRVVARAERSLRIEKTGETAVDLVLSNLGNIKLWDVDSPKLYEVRVVLSAEGQRPHEYRTRIGFRKANFEVDGFFLNGRRLRIFGLDRHELYPYVGFAMPRRVLRRDAEILRHTFNCNFVRCSHYPQSEAFIEACDELGLMVWEELPGWQYLGDESWKERAVRDVRSMVRRDRNHPSIVIWGVRINESRNDPTLYRKTKEAAYALDGTRPTSGTMTRLDTTDWLQDVFAYDDYHASPDGSVDIARPLPGVPYFVTEAVGQFNYAAQRGFDAKYRRAGDIELQMKQAILHAQAHDKGAAFQRLGGLVAWCAFDYGSLMNSYDGVKCPGIADIFRIPKLGASFYMAQVDPKKRPVIEPNFYWYFGPQQPSGPGKKAAIFSNCERLELFINGKHHATVYPDRTSFPHILYPPFFADLSVDGSGQPELRIEGYIGERRVLSRSFSSDVTKDQLLLNADAKEIRGDGIDATRLEFKAADRYGALRPFVGGEVRLVVEGPGELVGDNPFDLGLSGGAGAVWLKARAGKPGRTKVTASHPSLGSSSVEIGIAVSPRSRL